MLQHLAAGAGYMGDPQGLGGMGQLPPMLMAAGAAGTPGERRDGMIIPYF